MHKGILIDINIMQDEEYIKKKSILVWGAGDKGKYVLKMLRKANIPVSYVCDSNVQLWGKKIENHSIMSPYKLFCMTDKRNLCVVLCTLPGNYQTIQKILDNIFDGEYECATYFGIVNMFRFHYETLFQEESMKCIFKIEKKIGWLEFQQRELLMLKKICEMDQGSILVLQPGKVGSSSILANLLREGCEAYHFHHIHFPANILQEEYRKIWETALKNLKEKKLKIITGVREPISRDVSAFFETFSERNNIRRGDWLLQTGDLYKSFEQYVDMILYGNYGQWEDGIAQVWGDEFLWFDWEIKKLWGIDIYQFPFDREKGYSIIQSANIEIFLYKCEKLNNISEALYEFALNRSGTQFLSENRADVSWRSEAYQEFKNNLVLNSDYVDHYYKNNARIDYFYTEEEKSGFLKRWQNQIK